MLISTNNICGVIFSVIIVSSPTSGRHCCPWKTLSVPFATNPRSGVAILDYLLSDRSERFIPNRVLDMYKAINNDLLKTVKFNQRDLNDESE